MNGLVQHSKGSEKGGSTRHTSVKPRTDLKRARISLRAGCNKQSSPYHASKQHVLRTGEYATQYPVEADTIVFRENFRLSDFSDHLPWHAWPHHTRCFQQQLIPSWFDLLPDSLMRDRDSDTKLTIPLSSN